MLKQFRIAGQPLVRFPHGPLPSARRPDLELTQLISTPRNLAISRGPRIRPGKAGPTRDVCTLKDLK